jgi:translation initiation factor 1
LKKKSNSSSPFVYSTDPNFQPPAEKEIETKVLLPTEQKLIVRLETKHRAGKIVTIVDGFSGTPDNFEEVSKKLKNHCGTGGSAKDGEILVQGDHKEKVFQWLIKNGFIQAKKK